MENPIAIWTVNIFLKCARKCWRAFTFFISLPIVLMLIFLFPVLRVKFICLFSDRIGHYAMNTELLLCHLDELKQQEKKTKYYFYLRESPICNIQLHLMWKRIIPIVPLKLSVIASHIDFCLSYILGEFYKDDNLKKYEVTAGYENANDSLKKHPIHLYFTHNELANGDKLLSELGIPVNSKWVCLLARDSAYLEKYFPETDWSYHSYRDCDIQNFSKAALFLANQGYYVIRMGKAVTQIFDLAHPSIIDYANLPLQSDFADIYLSARCEFFVSTSLGLDAVPQIFRKPVIFINVPPIKNALDHWYPCEFFILKKVFDREKQRLVSLKEIDLAIIDNTNFNQILSDMNWMIIENDESEILDVVVEMVYVMQQENIKENINVFQTHIEGVSSILKTKSRKFLTENPEKFYIKIGNNFFGKNKASIFSI